MKTKDITEGKKMESALRGSEAKFRTLVETVGVAIFIFQGDKNRYVNPAAEKITGYTKEELLDMDFWEVVHPDFLGLVKERGLARQKGEKVPSRYEVKIARKNGEERWVYFTGTAIEFEGEPAVLGIVYDITERKRADEALRASEEKYRQLFENSPLGIFHYDQKGVITACNENFTKIIGAPKEKLIGFNMMTSLKDEKMKAAVAAPLSGNSGYFEGDYLSVTGGKLSTVKADFSPIRSGEGSLLGAVGIIEDIAERKQAEEALKESEKKYRDLFDNANDGICLVDTSGNITIYNPKFAEMFGYPEKEIIGKSSGDFVHPDDRKRVMEIQKKRFMGKDVPPVYEFLGVKKSGEPIYIEINTNLIKDRGRIIGTRAMLRDITERKKAEVERVKLYNAINSTMDGVAITDLEGNIAYINDAYANSYGYKREELLGKHVSIFYSEEAQRGLQERIKAIKEKGIWRGEVIGTRKDGSQIPISLSATIIKDMDGNPIGMVGVARDITKRKQAEEEIKKIKAFNEKIVQSMQDGVCVEDSKGLITYLNPQAEKMLGYASEELIGEHWSKITSKRYMKKAEKETAKRSQGISSRYECEVVRKDGEIIPVINSATPLFEGGKFTGVLSVFTDISEQKEREEKLRKKMMKYRLDWGSVYYADEVRFERGLDAFIDIVDLGYRGAVVSRVKPDELKAKTVGKAPVLWLSKKAHKASVPPSLPALAKKIEELLTDGRVIFFQGLEYQISKNGFENTLKFLQDLNELIYIENAIMILSFDSRALNERQLALIQKEVLPLILKHEKEMPERFFALLKFVYERNIAGIKPSYKDVCCHFAITRNTARGRIKYLVGRSLLLDVPRGRTKVLELTELGKEYL